ncbi:hypothetical protein HL670_03333 [Serratia plymuthica]|uniref:nuclear transport factor 2 family protein n=1 Tax=Serratia plymuthica TaxID=82996 RepID=UPI0003485081|nr:nuclear transport factor 2 family protein [Serratia plymuthica]QJW56437.1 hypothetical protein HL670_03333 [Serratia plymuthica]
MKLPILAVALAFALTLPAAAQERVTPAETPEALFTSPDPKLHANKQVVYRIIHELLEAGHWDRADELLSGEYLQHNPNAASGRAAVVDFFTKVLKVQPKPIPERISIKVVSVVAEGDLVVVSFVRTEPDPRKKGQTYTTTWFDMWRIRDGKAVEHWDPALVGESPNLD